MKWSIPKRIHTKAHGAISFHKITDVSSVLSPISVHHLGKHSTYVQPLVVGRWLLGNARCEMLLSSPLWGVAQAEYRHCTRPFPLKSGPAMWDYLYIGTQFVLLQWQVDLAHLQRLATNYNYLTSASASPQPHIIRICVNSPKWVITTTCDVVYPMFNVHQLKYNDIIGNLGTCHQVKWTKLPCSG